MCPLPLRSLRKTGEGAWTPMGGVPGPPVQATATRCPTRVSEHRADERVWVGQGSRADQRTLVTMTLSVLGPPPRLGTHRSHRGRAPARGWRSTLTESEVGPAPVGIHGSRRPSWPLRARRGDSQNQLEPSGKKSRLGSRGSGRLRLRDQAGRATLPVRVPGAEGSAPADLDSFPPRSCCSPASVSFWNQSRALHETESRDQRGTPSYV